MTGGTAKLAAAAGPRRTGRRSLARLRAAVEFAYPLVTVLLLWELVVRLGWIKAGLLPPPSRVCLALVRLLGPGGDTGAAFVLEHHFLSSIGLLASGVVLTVLIGIGLGLAVGLSPLLDSLLSPLLALIVPIPSLAWMPILLISLGRGDKTTIIVIVLGSFAPVLYNTREGVRSVTPHMIWAVQSMGAGRLTVISKVLLPGAFGHMLTGCRLAVAYGWRALVAAEMVAAAGAGLGFMIFSARSFMATDVMLAGVAVIAATGLAIEHLLFRALERITVRRWGLVRD